MGNSVVRKQLQPCSSGPYFVLECCQTCDEHQWSCGHNCRRVLQACYIKATTSSISPLCDATLLHPRPPPEHPVSLEFTLHLPALYGEEPSVVTTALVSHEKGLKPHEHECSTIICPHGLMFGRDQNLVETPLLCSYCFLGRPRLCRSLCFLALLLLFSCFSFLVASLQAEVRRRREVPFMVQVWFAACKRESARRNVAVA